MTQKEINNGNELIARFMGGKSRKVVFCKFPNGEYFRWSQLKYHSDWNLLMPVIEKIETNAGSEYRAVEIVQWKCLILKPLSGEIEFSAGSDVSKIEAVWKACIEFINWYNKNKKS